MTKPLLICCGSVRPKEVGLESSHYEVRTITMKGPNANLRLESFEPQILERLPPICKDAIDIAAYVYAADRLVLRGSAKDTGEAWHRKFTFCVPVRCIETWVSKDVVSLLQEVLGFLSGDSFEFRFFSYPNESVDTTLLEWPNLDSKAHNAVALFSGGMDSLAGVIHDLAQNNITPALVSHWPLSRSKARQSQLVNRLRERYEKPTLLHVQALTHLRGERHPEPTQRTRSYLYLSLAVALAYQLNITRVRVYENGVVSLNLPIWRQCVGSMDTRTTHPKFLNLFTNLMLKVMHRAFTIDNPFTFKTRAEVIDVLISTQTEDLLALTTSCSRIMWMQKDVPHCGVCSQCIDRRFSVKSRALAEKDPSTGYENDIFSESLKQIEAKEGWKTSGVRAMALGYLKSAVDLNAMPLDQILIEYPELYDAIPHLGIPEHLALEKIYDLQCRQAKMVLDVATLLVSENASGVIKGKLHPDSLIGIAASQGHLKNNVALLANEIGALLESGLPKTFQSHAPKNEQQVNDAADAILGVAKLDLEREFPQLSFAVVVGVKSDFATRDGRLYIEMKYPRPNSRTVNKITSEMTGKILQYQQHAGKVLFVVYDHHRMISDRKRYCADLQKHDGIFVRIIV